MLAIATSGCRKNAARSEVSDVEVVAVGDTSLMLQTVLRQIPRGLEPADSMAMFRSIVETWLRRQVLTEFAERNIPDMEDVDRMVEQYRNDLILSKYLSMMDRTGDQDVSSRRIDRYLSQRRDSMILEEPVVKGIFVKVPEDDSNLAAIREWMKTPGDHSLDRMEKKGLRGATQYEYFLDRWHDWHEVADLVPYRFFDADAFLQDNKLGLYHTHIGICGERREDASGLRPRTYTRDSASGRHRQSPRQHDFRHIQTRDQGRTPSQRIV